MVSLILQSRNCPKLPLNKRNAADVSGELFSCILIHFLMRDFNSQLPPLMMPKNLKYINFIFYIIHWSPDVLWTISEPMSSFPVWGILWLFRKDSILQPNCRFLTFQLLFHLLCNTFSSQTKKKFIQNRAGMDVGPSILFRVSSFLIRNSI